MRKFTILWLLASSIAINVYSQTVSLDNTFGQNGRTIIPNPRTLVFLILMHTAILLLSDTLLKSESEVQENMT
jgi:hypothetical protein